MRVTHPSALCCCGCSSCVRRNLRPVILHLLYLSAAPVCDRSTLTMDGNVRTAWIKISTSTVLIYAMFCVSSPKLTPEILTSENMRRTPTLQPRLAAQAAAGHTTSVWQVRGVLLWLVALSEAAIRHQSSPPLSCAVLCMYVCAVSRVSRKYEYGSLELWSNGHDARFWI